MVDGRVVRGLVEAEELVGQTQMHLEDHALRRWET